MSLRLSIAALALSAGLGASPALAANAGFTVVSVPDPQGAPITVGVWYPTEAEARPMALGIGDQTAAPGGPLKGDHLPLIVMSHGNGGFFGGHADTAQALAEAGFVVAALTHTGDNYADQSKATDMANRPRQLSVLIDYMLTASPMKAAIDPRRVGAFGFSSGGFTVLAAAGGKPDLSRVLNHCRAHPDFFDCKLTASRPLPISALLPSWTHDARIRAVVSAAPALGYSFRGQQQGDHAGGRLARRRRPDPARSRICLGGQGGSSQAAGISCGSRRRTLRLPGALQRSGQSHQSRHLHKRPRLRPCGVPPHLQHGCYGVFHRQPAPDTSLISQLVNAVGRG